MAITDQQILSEIQYHVMEPTIDGGVTWTSGMWAASEVLGYLNQRQDRFLKESQLLASWTTIAVTAGLLTPALPNDWIATVRISWQSSGGTTFIRLPRADTWSADMGKPTWPTVTALRPAVYMDSMTQTLQIMLAPAPTGAGVLSMYYVSTANPLTGSGEIFTVPDEFVPYIKWGTVGDMFTKLGRVQDVERAAYCEMRFEEGVELAKSWLFGWG